MTSNEEQLIIDHEPLARRQALAFCARYKLLHESDDIQSLAMIGLCKAARLWKPELGAKFSTFAYLTIHHTMLCEVRKRSARDEQAGRHHADLPQALGVEVHRVLDAPDEEPVIDMSYAGQATAEELVDRETVRALVNRLPRPHREYMRLRYLEDVPPPEVRRRLGVCKSKGRRLEIAALDMLRGQFNKRTVRLRLPEQPIPQKPKRDMRNELRISKADLLKLRERLEAEHQARLQQIDAAISLFDSGLLSPVMEPQPAARAEPEHPRPRMQMGRLREIAEQAAGEMPSTFTLSDFHAAAERLSGKSLGRASVSCQLQRLIDRGVFVQLQKGSRGRASVFRRAEPESELAA